MSPTARVALTVVCWTVAAVTELAGFALLARESRRARLVLRTWRAVQGNPDAPRAPELLDQLLENRFDRSAAVVLLVTGVIAGAIGNFLSL
jgi:hypothetical protein